MNLQLPCQQYDKTFETLFRFQCHMRGMHGPGYTTCCQAYTYPWPGKRNRHQIKCDTCIDIYQKCQLKKFPGMAGLRDS